MHFSRVLASVDPFPALTVLRSHMPQLRIGISGWTYAPWRGVFYPQGVTQKRELEYASRTFNSIEINGTFYSMQRPTTFKTWHDQTPDDFIFAVKGGRFITHMRRLVDCETALANFFAQGVLELREKLGPILWQLPPTMKFEPDRLESFIKLLPRDMRAASNLAMKHDQRVRGRASFEIGENHELRHAFEVRHETFRDEAFIKLLRKHNVALVVADTAGRYPLLHDVTADFVYVRLHGDEELYASGYSDVALDAWAKKVVAWSKGKQAADVELTAGPPPKLQGRDVYVYFDNDAKVHAPFDAASLALKVGVRKEPLAPSANLARVDEQVRESWPAIAGTKPTAKARSMNLSRTRIVRNARTKPSKSS